MFYSDNVFDFAVEHEYQVEPNRHSGFLDSWFDRLGAVNVSLIRNLRLSFAEKLLNTWVYSSLALTLRTNHSLPHHSLFLRNSMTNVAESFSKLPDYRRDVILSCHQYRLSCGFNAVERVQDVVRHTPKVFERSFDVVLRETQEGLQLEVSETEVKRKAIEHMEAGLPRIRRLYPNPSTRWQDLLRDITGTPNGDSNDIDTARKRVRESLSIVRDVFDLQKTNRGGRSRQSSERVKRSLPCIAQRKKLVLARSKARNDTKIEGTLAAGRD